MEQQDTKEVTLRNGDKVLIRPIGFIEEGEVDEAMMGAQTDLDPQLLAKVQAIRREAGDDADEAAQAKLIVKHLTPEEIKALQRGAKPTANRKARALRIVHQVARYIRGGQELTLTVQNLSQHLSSRQVVELEREILQFNAAEEKEIAPLCATATA
jgi:alkylhydroperoxidase family enzyme